MFEQNHQKILNYRTIIDKVYKQISVFDFTQCELFDNMYAKNPTDINFVSMLMVLSDDSIHVSKYNEKYPYLNICNICGISNRYAKTSHINLCKDCHSYLKNNKSYVSSDQLEEMKSYYSLYSNNFTYNNPMRLGLKIILHNSKLVLNNNHSFMFFPRQTYTSCFLCTDSYFDTAMSVKYVSNITYPITRCASNEYFFPEEYVLCQKHYIKMIKISDDDYVNAKLVYNFFRNEFCTDILNVMFN